MFYKCLLWGMGKQNNLLKVTVVTMQVGELALMKQQDSWEQRRNYPRSSLLSTRPQEIFAEKCQGKEIQPPHKVKPCEYGTTCIASCTLNPGVCSDSSKICREKELKPIISKNKMTSLCKRSFSLSLLVRDGFMSRCLMFQKALITLSEDAGNFWKY